MTKEQLAALERTKEHLEQVKGEYDRARVALLDLREELVKKMGCDSA